MLGRSLRVGLRAASSLHRLGCQRLAVAGASQSVIQQSRSLSLSVPAQRLIEEDKNPRRRLDKAGTEGRVLTLLKEFDRFPKDRMESVG